MKTCMASCGRFHVSDLAGQLRLGLYRRRPLVRTGQEDREQVSEWKFEAGRQSGRHNQ